METGKHQKDNVKCHLMCKAVFKPMVMIFDFRIFFPLESFCFHLIEHSIISEIKAVSAEN